MLERRANVRVRPAADYDVRVELKEGVVSVRLSVMDVSVTGLGLVIDEMFLQRQSGELLPLSITLPGHAPFHVQAEIRYSSRTLGGKCGVLFSSIEQSDQAKLGRAVAELLERGNAA
jgi:c-di-GMP-binding flagellar brake protein YcgR